MKPCNLVLLLSLFSAAVVLGDEKIPADTFGIQVLDEATGRGVPLIELKTVNDISSFTDSRGWVAFREPGLMGKEVYFSVAGPGYEYPKDGFGFRGTRLTTKPGTTATIKVKRTQAAERMGRLTGQGIERDSTLLGFASTDADANARGGVLGSDSVQAVPYRNRLFWLWGDTNLAPYPLGNFHTTAATSPRLDPKNREPIRSVAYDYFMDPAKPARVRAMLPMEASTPVWLFGLMTLKEDGKEILLAHFTRRKNLAEQLEHGLCQFDDEAGVFKKFSDLDLKETWRFPRNNAFRVTNDEGDYFYFAAPFAHTRVRATFAAVRDPSQYEALRYDPTKKAYHWQRDQAPTTQADEAKLLKANEMPSSIARYNLTASSAKKEPVSIHTASIAWNGYRKKWILIGLQQSWNKTDPSHLGEVWYAESEAPTGPWTRAVKIASHPNYSFYNPRIHDFFAQEDGKIIYFEGTYTHTFSGNTTPIPRYEYNQLLYRLDLSDDRLNVVR